MTQHTRTHTEINQRNSRVNKSYFSQCECTNNSLLWSAMWCGNEYQQRTLNAWKRTRTNVYDARNFGINNARIAYTWNFLATAKKTVQQRFCVLGAFNLLPNFHDFDGYSLSTNFLFLVAGSPSLSIALCVCTCVCVRVSPMPLPIKREAARRRAYDKRNSNKIKHINKHKRRILVFASGCCIAGPLIKRHKREYARCASNNIQRICVEFVEIVVVANVSLMTSSQLKAIAHKFLVF